MGVAIGFVLGYFLALSQGPLDFAEIRKAWGEIKSSEEMRTILAGGAGIVKQMLEQGSGELVEEAASVAASKLTIGQRLRLFLFGHA